ncbi:MAG: hypothetical protein WBS20_14330 [Lysobacterales bacterium]
MQRVRSIFTILALSTILAACSESTPPSQTAMAPAATVAPLSGPEIFSILIGGTPVGQLEAKHTAGNSQIEYEYRNNGRGPTISEKVSIGENGLPTGWTITGARTFGNKIDEQFALNGGEASWKDATGAAKTTLSEPSIYVAQDASPYAIGIYARALLADEDRSMPVLPGGTLRLDEIETMNVNGEGGEIPVTAYALSGIDINPTYFLLDQDGEFFAVIRT